KHFCLMAVQAGNSFQFQELPDIRMERRRKLLKNGFSLWHGLLVNGKVFYVHIRPPSLLVNFRCFAHKFTYIKFSISKIPFSVHTGKSRRKQLLRSEKFHFQLTSIYPSAILKLEYRSAIHRTKTIYLISEVTLY